MRFLQFILEDKGELDEKVPNTHAQAGASCGGEKKPEACFPGMPNVTGEALPRPYATPDAHQSTQ